MNISLHQQALTALASLNPVTYEANRNYTDGGTRLSVFITRGILTLPQIHDHLVANYSAAQRYKLTYELAWREYWQREWLVRGDAIRDDIKTDQQGVESSDIPQCIVTAQTGIHALDTGIEQLYETGYVHNHMRMWLSGLISNIAHTKWQQPAAWMYYHLLDGDPASNSLSWQWVAGTFSSKQYLPSQENINTFSKTVQHGTFLDTDYESLATIKTPAIFAQRDATRLIWTAPTCDEVSVDSKKPTMLYHSFWINSEWRQDLDANRILVLDPAWFARFPVSTKVTDSIIQIAREIPGMQIFVGSIADLAVQCGTDIYYMDHPTAAQWPGQADHMPLLFPAVPLRSFNSFTSYWKKCEKNL